MATLIFTHGDCDGVCSGALALAANPGAKVFFTNPVSILSDMNDAWGYDRFIACDLAINLSTSDRFKEKMDALSRDMEVMYIDHHPLPAGFRAKWLIHEYESCGALLTFKHFRKRMSQDMSRIAMYGAIGDYRDMTALAQELTRLWDKRSLYYEAGIVSQGVEMDRRDHDFKRETLLALSHNTLPSSLAELSRRAAESSRQENEMRQRVKRNARAMKNLAYAIDPKGSLSKAAIYARAYSDRPVGVSADHRREKRIYDISVRAVGDYNLNVVLDRVATRLGGTGGGHPQAGGARIPEKQLKQFLADLDSALDAPTANSI